MRTWFGALYILSFVLIFSVRSFAGIQTSCETVNIRFEDKIGLLTDADMNDYVGENVLCWAYEDTTVCDVATTQAECTGNSNPCTWNAGGPPNQKCSPNQNISSADLAQFHRNVIILHLV